MFIHLIVFTNSVKAQYRAKKERFENFENSVKKEVFNKFPPINRVSESVSMTILNPYSLDISEYCGIFLKYKFENKDTFKSEIKSLIEKKLYKARFSDSCFYKVSNKTIDQKKDCKRSYPIPSNKDDFNLLENFISSNTESYVFNSKKGNFFSNSFIEDINTYSLEDQKKYKAGNFSNGAFVNYETLEIIYWVIIF